MRSRKHDRERGGVVGEQDVGDAARPQLRADRDVPEQGEGQRSRRAAATEDRLESRGGIEHDVDGARLQGFVGFTSLRHIHPCDLVYQTGEVAAGQLAMDDGPDHASLLTTREASLVPVIYLAIVQCLRLRNL